MPKQNELIPFTFSDTGETILIRKVSPLLGLELQKAFPPPKPPVQEVDYGDGRMVKEANAAHPDYLSAMQAYQIDFEDKLRRLYIKRGAVITWSEERRAQVDELRSFWHDEYGIDLPGDDTMVFVSYLCIGSDKDLENLVTAIMQRSQPTEAAVAEAVETFPG